MEGRTWSILSAEIRAMGDGLNPDLIQKTRDMYGPFQAPATDDVAVVRDERYGPHQRHHLDVYRPAGAAGACPVLIFVHGGGFVGGDQGMNENIGRFFAKNGMVAVLPTYRLAPDHVWPSGAEDMALVLDWVRNHIRRFGGRPEQVFLSGHSAGAAHVATYLFFNQFHPADGDGLTGAVLISGTAYDTSYLGPIEWAYYGRDESRYPDRSVMNRLESRRVPLYIVYAELDPPKLRRQSAGLFAGLCREGCPSDVFIRTLADHNHLSEICQIDTARDSLGPDLLAFFRSIAERSRQGA